jgi:hypothetical protein
MAITLSPDRQTILVASKTVGYADLTTATAVPAFDVPAGAIVVGGDVTVTEAWNSATDDTLDVGDGDDTDRYSSTIIDNDTTGRTALTLTGYKYTAADTVDLLWTGTGAVPTAGSLRIHLWYIIEGRGNEIQA